MAERGKKMKNLFKRILAVLCVCMLVISEVPASAAEDVAELVEKNIQQTEEISATKDTAAEEQEDGGSISVATQKQLKAALASEAVTAGKEVTIRIETAKSVTFTIPEGDYGNVIFCVEGAKAKIKNKASVSRMVIYDAKSYTEYAEGNELFVYDRKLTVNAEKSSQISSVKISNSRSKITLKNNGIIDMIEAVTATDLNITQNNRLDSLVLQKSATVDMSGSVKAVTEITVGKKADGSTVKTSVPSQIKLYGGADITFRTGASRETSDVTLMTEGVGYSVKNSTKKAITINGADGRKSYARKNETVEKEATVEPEVNEVSADTADEASKTKTEEIQTVAETQDDEDEDEYVPYVPSEPVRTTYYEIRFEAGSGVDASGLSLPDAMMFEANARVGSLPAPYKQNAIFLGWYYDAACTNAVAENDQVTSNTTVYAKLTETEGVVEEETPNYVSVTIPAGEVASYSFGIRNFTAGDVSFVNVSAGNEEVLFTVGDGGAVNVALEQGQTYTVTIADDVADVFVINGVMQPESIRVFNIITEKTEVQKLSLIEGITYIPAEQVTHMSGNALDGLFTASVETNTLSQNTYEGGFTYSGAVLNVGDQVAIYSGTRPDLRTLNSDNGAVAYVTISGRNGSSYTYQSSDATDVLFTPDVIPVLRSADMDGDADNASITVASTVFDFSDGSYSDLGLNSETTIDKGDYIVLYEGNIDDPSWYQYVVITSVSKNDTSYTVAYALSSEEEMAASMDIYSSRNEDIELSDAEIEQIEREMERQAYASGFVDNAAEYLTALALETDGFRELSDDLDMDLSSYMICFEDGTELQPGDVQLMSGSTATIKDLSVQAAVVAGKSLQHFSNKSGVRVELSVSFLVQVSNHVNVELKAVFEQEVMLSLNISGSTVTHKKWIFTIIDDYQMTANIDVGTYTGIGITATAYTPGEEDEKYDWKNVSGTGAEQKIINIGKQITELIDKKDQFLGKDLVDENGEEAHWAGTQGGGLPEKYARFMENVEEAWFEIVRVKIFKAEGSVDPLHVMCYGVGADFVVKATMYVTMGMTFSYSNAKRYSFSFRLKAKTSSSSTVDLEESNYNFDFYVMGTMGIRAGIELEVGVGLFSLNLDSIGITADVGAYAQLWGYFYYHCSWSQSKGKTSGSSGALLIEVGAYLEIKFKAQLFSSNKLTYNPTLYENTWPFLQIGQRENVYEFAEISEDSGAMEIKSAKSFTLPNSVFDMNYMQLNTGELYGSDADDPVKNPALALYNSRTSKFTVSVSNPKFSYNLNTNTVTVNPAGSIEENCVITIVYKGGTLAFTSKPIAREINIHWTDEAGARFIQFSTNGGTSVDMIRTGVGGAVTAPSAPTKTGYTFGGWYSDASLKTAYTMPRTMPDYNTSAGRGIVVYAKWIPATNTKYTVEHYLQKQNGTYELAATEVLTGTTDADSAAVAKTAGEYANYTAKAIAQSTIAPNGSTVVKVYYVLKSYTVTYTFGAQADGTAATAPVSVTEKYGKSVFVPVFAKPGYVFAGFVDAAGQTLTYDAESRSITVAGDATYTAVWRYASDTGYKIERYVETQAGNYTLFTNDAIILGQGETNSLIDIYADELDVEGMTFIEAKVGDTVTTAPTIAADGSTVVKMYYDRARVTVSFEAAGGVIAAGEETKEFKYGQHFAANAPTRAQYIFEGWFDAEGHQYTSDTTVTAAVTLTAGWREDTVEYTVEHYVMGLDGLYGDVTGAPETKGALRGAVLTLSDLCDSDRIVPGGIEYDVAKIDGSDQAVTTAEAAEGLVVKIYYKRIRHTFSCKIYYGMGPEDYEPYGDPVEYYYGQTIVYPATPTYEGYDVTVDTDNRPETMGVEDVVGVFYKDGTRYILVYNSCGGSDITDRGVRYGEVIERPSIDPTKTGYVFDKWYKDTDRTVECTFTETMPIGGMEIYAGWIPADDTPYSVEHYQQQVNVTGYALIDTENLTGTTGSVVSASAISYDHFYLNPQAEGTVSMDTVAANGSTVLKLFYDRETYTVSYDANGGSFAAGEGADRTFMYQELFAADTPSQDGYDFAGWFDGEKEYTSSEEITGNVTVVAHWTERPLPTLHIIGEDILINQRDGYYELVDSEGNRYSATWSSSDTDQATCQTTDEGKGYLYGVGTNGTVVITATTPDNSSFTKTIQVLDYEHLFALHALSGVATLGYDDCRDVEVDYPGTGVLTLHLDGAMMYSLRVEAPDAAEVIIDGLGGTETADVSGNVYVDAPNASVTIDGLECENLTVICTSSSITGCTVHGTKEVINTPNRTW